MSLAYPRKVIQRATDRKLWEGLGYVPDRLSRGTSAGGTTTVSGSGSGVTIEVSPSVLQSMRGFGFFESGLMQAGELLGSVTWGYPRTFEGTTEDTIDSLWGATGLAVFLLRLGTGLLAGTITFNNSDVGVLVWAGGNVPIPPGVPLEIYAPTPANPTLASVNAQIYASA